MVAGATALRYNGLVSLAERIDDDPEDLASRITERHAADPVWLDRFESAIARQRSAAALERILAIWHLSKAEAAGVFGVSRQALTKWSQHGVPPDRAVAVGNLAAATDLLVRYLRRDRIPAVVRRPFDDADGLTLLQLATDDSAVALGHVRRMFDVSRIHA